MRLINTFDGLFHWTDNPKETKYAVLSHVWSKGSSAEQSYQDLVKIQDQVRIERVSNPQLPDDAVFSRVCSKVSQACERARADGLQFIWIDTCCIDKSSSTELSEAINSMYTWYSDAAACYVLLPDVDADEDPLVPRSSFRQSVWFTRGWTLQELIAPTIVVFFSCGWHKIGGKHSLSGLIEEVTGIDKDILLHRRPLSSVSVARRMFWASRRVTTRKEDIAYSLMGIFGINIPTVYGEGDRAFVRLQEEILKEIPDQSIFVWDRLRNPLADFPRSQDNEQLALLATSPAAFLHSGDVNPVPPSKFAEFLRRSANDGLSRAFLPTPVASPYGMHITLWNFPDILFHTPSRIAPIACQEGEDHVLALVLRSTSYLRNHGVYTVGVMPAEDPLRRLQSPHMAPGWRWGCWPRMYTLNDAESRSSFVRLVYLPVNGNPSSIDLNGIKPETSELCIAHLPSKVPPLSILKPGGHAVMRVHLDGPSAPSSSLSHGALIYSRHIDMTLHQRHTQAVASRGYSCFLTAGHILEVSSTDHSISITFDVEPAPHSTTPAQYILRATYASSWTPTGTPTAAHEDWSDTATIVSGGLEPPRATGSLKDAYPGEQTAVADWDHATRPDASARERVFPLSPLGQRGGRLQVTISCDSPGSALFPALFSLAVDVLGPVEELEEVEWDDADTESVTTTVCESGSGPSRERTTRRFRNIFRPR